MYAVKPQKKSNHLHYANYVVSFLDLLGQSDQLLATPSLVPKTSDKNTLVEFENGLLNTFVPTTQIQRDFESAFAPLTAPPWLKKLPVEHQKTFKKSRKNRVKFQRFSDGHIAYLDLSNEHTFERAFNISRIITGCCSAMISSLSRGHPIRGGIAIGWGIEFEKNFYGAVIAKAHHLESKVAHYPRIVIDDYVMQYLRGIIKESANNPMVSMLNTNEAEIALSHIVQDEYDGQWVVNYLGPIFLDNDMKNDALGLIKNAHDFVKSEFQKYKAKGSSPNTKLAMRYAMVDHYFTQRLTQAGVLK
jgi:hypothetical protein